jgi:dihydroflavonol-4-reductase
MHNILVTGASSFLGYHVAKRLNEQGVRPRALELRGSQLAPLNGLDVSRCEGDLGDADAVEAACAGVDTVLHLAFKVSVGGGEALLEEMRATNIGGTRRLLDTAAAAGVSRVVIASSALAVGVNRRPQPLDESASWAEHALDLPYATIRREAEQEALAKARPGFAVVAVSPSFTMGPDDPVGAPANTLLRKLVTGKQRFTLPVGFGCLDVRDFAEGAISAAQRGLSGERYLLSGHNVTASQLLQQAADIAGVRAPRFEPPRLLLSTVVGAIGMWSRLSGRPAPVTPEILQILGRYAWYDTSRARAALGWEPRPLQQTLEDTIAWLRDGGSA